jgi:hypothetical protein
MTTRRDDDKASLLRATKFGRRTDRPDLHRICRSQPCRNSKFDIRLTAVVELPFIHMKSITLDSRLFGDRIVLFCVQSHFFNRHRLYLKADRTAVYQVRSLVRV